LQKNYFYDQKYYSAINPIAKNIKNNINIVVQKPDCKKTIFIVKAAINPIAREM
jgi:hypothetical protein